jgi:CHAT domain-containing protein
MTTSDLDSLVEREKRAIEDEIQRIDLGRLDAFYLSREATIGFNVAQHVILLPPEYRAPLVANGLDVFEPELLAVGLAEAAEVLRPAGDTRLLALTLLSRAMALRHHASVDELWTLIGEAVTILGRLGERRLQGRALLELGNLLRDADNSYDALVAYERAEELLSATVDEPALIALHNYQATVFRTVQLYEEALLELDKVAPAPGAPGYSMLPTLFGERVPSLIEIGDLSGALAVIQERLSHVSADSADFNDAIAFGLRGRVEARLGDSRSSRADLSIATAIAARYVRKYSTLRFRSAERERLDTLFTETLALAVQSNAPELVIAALSLSKTVRPGVPKHPGTSSDELPSDFRQSFEDELAALARSATAAVTGRHGDAMNEASWEASKLVDRYDVLTASKLTGLDDPSPEQIANRYTTALSPDALAIEVFFAPDGNLWMVVIHRNEASLLPIRMELGDLALLARTFSLECSARQTCRSLNRLGNALLEPVYDVIQDVNTLYVVLPPPLAALPLHAVEVSGKPLISYLDVAYLPSFSFLLSPPGKRVSTGRPLVAIAPDPPYETLEPLRGAEVEANAVAALLPSADTIVGDEAIATTILTNGMRSSILHLAGHAAFDPSRPLLARVFMNDRPVFAFEVATRDTNASIVNLSGCRTAQASHYAGGESEGLATAFLAAGAQTVVAAWWPVDDTAAALFTAAFYQELRMSERSSWRAVNAAQRHLATLPKCDHPAVWAPFVALGGVESMAN